VLGKILKQAQSREAEIQKRFQKLKSQSVISYYEDYINIANDELRTDLINLIFEKEARP